MVKLLVNFRVFCKIFHDEFNYNSSCLLVYAFNHSILSTLPCKSKQKLKPIKVDSNFLANLKLILRWHKIIILSLEID